MNPQTISHDGLWKEESIPQALSDFHGNLCSHHYHSGMAAQRA